MIYISNKISDHEKLFVKIIEIKMDESAEELLIWSDLKIESICAMSIEYDCINNKFIDKEILPDTFMMNIQVGDAVKIRLSLPCGIPGKRIIINEQDGKSYSIIPIRSGLDGSICSS